MASSSSISFDQVVLRGNANRVVSNRVVSKGHALSLQHQNQHFLFCLIRPRLYIHRHTLGSVRQVYYYIYIDIQCNITYTSFSLSLYIYIYIYIYIYMYMCESSAGSYPSRGGRRGRAARRRRGGRRRRPIIVIMNITITITIIVAVSINTYNMY